VPAKRELIEAALAQSNGKVSGLSGAAAKLGIPLNHNLDASFQLVDPASLWF